LIDPRTGQPAECVYTATVLAPTATLAELLSTAFFILGTEKTANYCSNHPEISAILTMPWENMPDLPFGTQERTGNIGVVEFNAKTE
jgi:thiamine biosynthesis lipoprotein ApbE